MVGCILSDPDWIWVSNLKGFRSGSLAGLGSVPDLFICGSGHHWYLIVSHPSGLKANSAEA